jgi:serine/threonine protein kinase
LSFIYIFYFYFEVHADIKPDNMVLVNGVLKVTDLGLAFQMNSASSVIARPRIRGTLGTYSHLSFFT